MGPSLAPHEQKAVGTVVSGAKLPAVTAEGPKKYTLIDGVRNMATYGNLQAGDRVLIITDRNTLPITGKLEAVAKERGADVKLLVMEDFAEARPMTEFPTALREAIRVFGPNKSYYAAVSQTGELGAFRRPMLEFLKELRTSHYHMPGIDVETVASSAICSDATAMRELTAWVAGIVSTAATIRVTAPNGTDITATFSHEPGRRWFQDIGIIEPGYFGNLPAGEYFTTPANVDGVFVTNVLGDNFGEEYGVLRTPMTVVIRNGRVVSVSHEDKDLEAKFLEYLHTDANSNCIGEFAIGTNAGVTDLSGNMLRDEKSIGVHIAVGDPHGDDTGATWKSKVHCDMVIQGCTIKVDGRTIMQDGEFVN